ncbi:5-formyltetrahydrofolate cyclo-ligase [Spiroplasma platyhelix]|uniref:5-formyltetrahydrofolate cyclo-ligase n=1 Tax=Spiroplasma platyhelix PALS-1 TaxID=1276218 RepID=A0A846TQ40_9MOLU|nr:5-formyltetrahydrofolate cyclo-ligase [Spiroplasma platyhelix]MBE4704050.1 5-formyltetrahydrofolate cyclo-ligase [Spiroplasma platyhelix PALS-1]NKE38420.1 5-formyltetrahydrofolate cyclo-ligase [Spiroplasma platyhelix PALS-1]UJB29308.1 5-formyltetrahydrofolate cyclo-ligase [Spiroplasma platyhelix PALS-1]
MSSEIKQQLRMQYLKILKNIDSKQKEQWDGSILQQFINSKYFHEANTIALYFSLPYEVETTKIIKILLENKKKVALPRMTEQNLVFYYINSLDELVVDNQWEIHQPKDTNQVVETKDLDLIILPLLGFNKKNYRLGHGRGYYDRFLSTPNFKALKLALAYKIQEIQLDVFFVDNWDVTFDALITNS